MQNKLPKAATLHSLKIEVKQGEKYFWCSCGLSTKQPLCDGSHAGTGFSPVVYTADECKLVSFCGCKQSKKGVICDGAHKQL